MESPQQESGILPKAAPANELDILKTTAAAQRAAEAMGISAIASPESSSLANKPSEPTLGATFKETTPIIPSPQPAENIEHTLVTPTILEHIAPPQTETGEITLDKAQKIVEGLTQDLNSIKETGNPDSKKILSTMFKRLRPVIAAGVLAVAALSVAEKEENQPVTPIAPEPVASSMTQEPQVEIGSAAVQAPQPEVVPTADTQNEYTIVAGDSLSSIAAKWYDQEHLLDAEGKIKQDDASQEKLYSHIYELIKANPQILDENIQLKERLAIEMQMGKKLTGLDLKNIVGQTYGPYESIQIKAGDKLNKPVSTSDHFGYSINYGTPT